MAGSVLGRDQLEETLTTGRDLFGEHSFQRASGPQLAAVVQAHRQLAEPVVLGDRRVEHPRRVIATVRLISFEHDPELFCVSDRADHS